jgi:ABC-type polysaccharide/polyol phosphate export permease
MTINHSAASDRPEPRTDSLTGRGVSDILGSLAGWRLWSMLGWLDIRQRYRRSMLGAFWITISMAIMVIALGVLYSSLFKMEIREFIPFLAAGLITWGFLSGTIGDSTTVFISAESIIKQGGIPLSLHVMRMIWRNVIIFAHNLTVIPFVYLWFGITPTWHLILFAPGLFLVLLNLLWVSLIIGPLCTRFRDLPSVISNMLQIFFFMSPIIYKPEFLAGRFGFLLDWNPFHHLIEVIRGPLLGYMPAASSYQVLTGIALVGGSAAWLFFRRFRGRIAYWL